MSLLRHSDRIDIACQAQLVNVIAPIRSEPGVPAWRQTIFHPFALTARHARGDVLRVEPRTPTIDAGARGEAPAVDVVATRDPETGEVAVFAVNRHPSESARAEPANSAVAGVAGRRARRARRFGPAGQQHCRASGRRPTGRSRPSGRSAPTAR